MNLQEFKGNVEQWAEARGIYENSTEDKQIEKFWLYSTSVGICWNEWRNHSEEDRNKTKLFGPMRTRDDLVQNILAYFPHLKEEDLT